MTGRVHLSCPWCPWTTIMLDRGVPESVRMQRLGHTTTGMARRYAHATEAPDRAAALALDEALG